MKSFNHFLREIGVENDVRSLLYHIARSVKYINFAIRAGETGMCGSQNSFGEDQLALDVLSDQIIARELEMSELAAIIASEEKSEAQKFVAPRGKFAIAYDPLDGSSLVDANLSIGSIFGIWPGDHFIGRTGEDMVAAVYAVYGPRITLVISIKNLGTHEFELNDVGEFILKRRDIKIKDDSKYFAPGNMKVAAENPKYKKLIDSWILEPKKLRYSGGMVPDMHHVLSKGEGQFTYPRCSKHPEGKLRLLFECAPFSFVFRECGGIGKNQEGQDILSIKITKEHQTTPIFIGSKNEINKALEFLK
jgi:fructose-1,6-bisphosphatase I